MAGQDDWRPGIMPILWAAAVVVSCASHAGAGEKLAAYRLDHVTAYPASAAATGTVTVDGDLGEWRPEAFVTIFQDPQTRDERACRVAVAYDEKGLYVAMDAKDDSPLENVIDPLADPFVGWRGDSMQMRFIAPGRRISHCTWWYFTERSVPALDVRYGQDFREPVTLTGDDSRLKYRSRNDGYTFELLLPWNLLHAKGPARGEWRTTLQPHWNVFGKEVITFFDCITAEEGSMYRRPQLWGELRFATAENAERLLAEQQAAETKRLKIGSDEAPSWGFPIKVNTPAEGFVSLAVADSKGHSVRTLLAKARRAKGEFTEHWDGLDDEGKPVPAGRYRVKALTHTGITPKFVTSVHNSGTPPWVTADGKGGWGADHGNPVDVAAGPDGRTYLMWGFNEAGHFLIGVDGSGRKQWGGAIPWGDLSGNATALAFDDGRLYVAKSGGLLVYDAATGARASFPNKESAVPAQQWPDAGTSVAGLAASREALYVSLSTPGRILALDKRSFRPVKTWDLPKAGAIACDAKRRLLYAVGGGRIVKIGTAGDSKPAPFVAQGLDTPSGICVDGYGNVYVAMQGKRMCVAVFSPEGRPLLTIGKEGGRPQIGRYDPAGMLRPQGICVDTKGRLWVAENDSTPRRVSQWNARTGRFLREFFGGSAYAVMMAPDPDRPEHVYLHNCRFIVDYDRGTSRPDATVFRAGVRGKTIPGSEAGYGFMGATFQVSRYQGRTFAYNARGGVFAWGEDEFKPLLAVGHDNGVWEDADGNGLVDEGETRRVNGVHFGNNIFQFGGAFFPGASFIRGSYNGGVFRVFRPEGLTPEGVPIYPKPEDAPCVLTGKGPMTRYSNWMDVWPSLESDWKQFYAIASLPHPVHHGLPDGGGGDGIFRFTRDGEILWRYPRVKVFYGIKEQRLARPGDLIGAIRIAGLVQMPPENGGEIICIGSYRAYFGLISGDGLFIDHVSDDKGKGLPPDFDTFFIENFSGYFFKHPRTGKAYLFCGDVDGRILELRGFENVRRFDAGTVTLRDTDVRALAEARKRPPRHLVRPRDRSLTAVAVPGAPEPDAAAFPARAMRRMELDETHSADVGLCYDRTNLHALFRVDDPSPWKNRATDWKMLFKSGDAVDVQLGDKNGRALVRVFAAPGARDGEFLAVGMWPTVPKGMDPRPQLYKSPVGQETFARVARLKHVAVKLAGRESGYTAVVTIPWTELGMAPPAAGASLRGDMGVLFSDPSGSRTIRRRYLFNANTGVVDDVPSEVRLAPQEWGTVRFK